MAPTDGDYQLCKDASAKVATAKKDEIENKDVDTLQMQLPCSHLFHPQCIMPWLDMKQVIENPTSSCFLSNNQCYCIQTCPICRYEITDKVSSVEELVRLFSRQDLLQNLRDLDVLVSDEGSKER